MKKSRDKISYSKATLSCLLMLVASVILYLYFLNMSVVQVVMRTEFSQEQNSLRTEIAQLEARYIDSQHLIAARISSLQGYETDVTKIFVSREPASLVLRDE
jgi:Tfp pilus assembly protein PilN